MVLGRASPLAAAEELDASLRAVGLMHALRVALAEMDDDAPLHLTKPVLRKGRKRRPVTDLTPFRLNKALWAKCAADACRLAAQASETAWPPMPAPATQRLGLTVADTYLLHGGPQIAARNRYGNKVFQDRVRRTYERTPELSWCPEGTVLRKVHRGERVEVTLFRDRFEHKGSAFASLSEIVGVVDGKAEYRMPPSRMSRGTRNQPRVSASKFFCEAFASLYLRALWLVHHREAHPGKTVAWRDIAPTACTACDVDFAAQLKKQVPNVRLHKKRHRSSSEIPAGDVKFYFAG